jgi:hypothetical protein
MQLAWTYAASRSGQWTSLSSLGPRTSPSRARFPHSLHLTPGKQLSPQLGQPLADGLVG